MTCIQPTRCNPQVIAKNSELTPKTRSECKNNPQALNKALLALATIGMATLSSCMKDGYIGPDFEEIEPATETITTNKTSTSPTKTYVSLEAKADTMLRTIGLLNDSTSLRDKKILYSKDDTGVQHWMRATGIYKEAIYGTGMSLLPDCSAGEIYSFRASSDGDNGLNVSKSFSDGTRQYLNYVQQDDNSIVEYEVVGNGYKLEKSTYKKQDDGSIVRTFLNGETMRYSDTDKTYPYPTPITFGAEIQGTQYEGTESGI